MMILLQFLLVLVDTIGISSLFTQEIIWKTSEKVFGATDKDISIRLPLSSEGIPELSVASFCSKYMLKLTPICKNIDGHILSLNWVVIKYHRNQQKTVYIFWMIQNKLAQNLHLISQLCHQKDTIDVYSISRRDIYLVPLFRSTSVVASVGGMITRTNGEKELLVVGGYLKQKMSFTTEVYNFKTNTWR